jgi:hypothetical protein
MLSFKSLLPILVKWISETSTQAALLTIFGVGTGLATHLMTKDAALLLAVPALIGLVVHDKQEAATLAADALPIAEDLASGDTSGAIKAAEAEGPAVLSSIAGGTSAIAKVAPLVASSSPAVPKMSGAALTQEAVSAVAALKSL